MVTSAAEEVVAAVEEEVQPQVQVRVQGAGVMTAEIAAEISETGERSRHHSELTAVGSVTPTGAFARERAFAVDALLQELGDPRLAETFENANFHN